MTENKGLVLYIEDDSDLKGVITDILSYEHIDVIMDSGKQLFPLLEKNEVSLILLDENLIWCKGSDLCRQIKRHKDFSNIPVVMVSGLWDIPFIAEDCGADGYIRKPFDMYDIITTVILNQGKKAT